MVGKKVVIVRGTRKPCRMENHKSEPQDKMHGVNVQYVAGVAGKSQKESEFPFFPWRKSIYMLQLKGKRQKDG